MNGERIDELAKALASGVGRRTALRWFGAGLAGGLVAFLRSGEAKAAPNPCAVLCADQPGARGAQCRQACRACGGDVQRTCLAPTGAVCCPEGSVCVSGNCEEPI